METVISYVSYPLTKDLVLLVHFSVYYHISIIRMLCLLDGAHKDTPLQLVILMFYLFSGTEVKFPSDNRLKSMIVESEQVYNDLIANLSVPPVYPVHRYNKQLECYNYIRDRYRYNTVRFEVEC